MSFGASEIAGSSDGYNQYENTFITYKIEQQVEYNVLLFECSQQG